MKKHIPLIIKRIIQILLVALLIVSVDLLVVFLSNDDSIWLGYSIHAVASIILGPIVGGLSALISSITTGFLIYQTFDYSFEGILEALASFLIGVIYRRLIKDQDKFGIREIVIFNFVQILTVVALIYCGTAPVGVLFFGSTVDEWSGEKNADSMAALASDTFSACVSIALLGTVLLAICTALRKQRKEQGSFPAALRSILKPDFISKEYRSRALEYSVGFVFAIALSMVDGVVSGHVLGTDALAAISIMFPLVSLSSFLSELITSGCSHLCANANGEGDLERAGKLFSLGLLATIVLGLLQTILFFLLQDLYFGYFTTSGAIEALARQYYSLYIFVPPFMAMAIFLDEVASSDGDDLLSYAGYLTSFGVNVGLSIVMSHTMGIGGLAFATMISYICYVIVVSTHFLKKSNTYRFRLHFSYRDLLEFARHSLKRNTSGLCMSATSTAFTKGILLFWGSDYLIANTVLCAMLEIYKMISGPSEAAEYLFATYEGEKNSEGIKKLFNEVLIACLFVGMVASLLLLVLPGTVLALYGIEDSPLNAELIQCIRFCSLGMIAAAVGGFLSDFYGNTGKPLWSCLLIVFRTSLFPIMLCVTFCLNGIVAMGKGMLLSQIAAVVIFYVFVLIVKGVESIPYMMDDPDYEKVKINTFTFEPEEYGRLTGWLHDRLAVLGADEKRIGEVQSIVLSICKKTEEENGKNKVYGECVLRSAGEPEVIIKDNGKLFRPDIEDSRYSYNVLMSCNRSMIRIS